VVRARRARPEAEAVSTLSGRSSRAKWGVMQPAFFERLCPRCLGVLKGKKREVPQHPRGWWTAAAPCGFGRLSRVFAVSRRPVQQQTSFSVQCTPFLSDVPHFWSVSHLFRRAKGSGAETLTFCRIAHGLVHKSSSMCHHGMCVRRCASNTGSKVVDLCPGLTRIPSPVAQRSALCCKSRNVYRAVTCEGRRIYKPNPSPRLDWVRPPFSPSLTCTMWCVRRRVSLGTNL